LKQPFSILKEYPITSSLDKEIKFLVILGT